MPKLTLNDDRWKGRVPKGTRHLNPDATTTYDPGDMLSDYPIFYTNKNDDYFDDKDYAGKKTVLRLPRTIRIYNYMVGSISDLPVGETALVNYDQGKTHFFGLKSYLDSRYRHVATFAPFDIESAGGWGPYLQNTIPFNEDFQDGGNNFIGGDCLNFVIVNGEDGSQYGQHYNYTLYWHWLGTTGFSASPRAGYFDSPQYPTRTYIDQLDRIKKFVSRFRKFKTVIFRVPLTIPLMPDPVSLDTEVPPWGSLQHPDDFWVGWPDYQTIQDAYSLQMDLMINGDLKDYGFSAIDISQGEAFATFSEISDEFFTKDLLVSND